MVAIQLIDTNRVESDELYLPWALSYLAISILVGFTVFKFQIILNHNEIFKFNQKSLPLSFSN